MKHNESRQEGLSCSSCTFMNKTDSIACQICRKTLDRIDNSDMKLCSNNSCKRDGIEVEGGILASINDPDFSVTIEKPDPDFSDTLKDFGGENSNQYGMNNDADKNHVECQYKHSSGRARSKRLKRPSEMEVMAEKVNERLIKLKKGLGNSLETEYGLDLPSHLPPFDQVTLLNEDKMGLCDRNPNCLCPFKKVIRQYSGKISDKKSLSTKRVQQYHEFIDHEENKSSLVLSSLSKQNGRIIVRVPPGLCNLGATCYLNSQLQCLASFPPFCKGILSLDASVYKCVSIKNVLHQLQAILAQIRYGSSNDAVDAKAFVESLGLVEDEMQDPVEFSRLLLDKLEQSLRELHASNPEQSLVTDIFRGKCRFNTQCLTCKKSVVSPTENFYDLLLPISSIPSRSCNEVKSMKTKGGYSVQSSIDAHLSPETLNGSNQYQCCNCGCNRDAIRSFEITELPKILSIQLSRYSYSNGIKTKVRKAVQVDRKLYITCNDGTIRTFVLVALQHHLGGGADTGHYIAETMDWTIGQWFKHDDEKVIMEDNPNLNMKNSKSGQGNSTSSQSVYSLFYASLDYIWDNITVITKEPFLDVVQNVLNHSKKLERETGKSLASKSKLVDALRNESDQKDYNWLPRQKLDDILDLKICPAHEIKLCQHERLHPMIFRSGKCISTKSLNNIETILREFHGCHDITIDTISVRDALCEKCIESQRNAKSEHCERFEKLANLLFRLKGVNDSCDNIIKAIFVSRKFVASIKQYIKKVLKQDMENGCSMDEGIDIFVNSSLICHHKNLNAIQSQYFAIHESLWEDICDLFPQAIKLSIGDNSKCSLCSEEKFENKLKIEGIENEWLDWSERFQADDSLLDLSLSPTLSAISATGSYCVVSFNAMEHLRGFLHNMPSKSDIADMTPLSLIKPYICAHNKVSLPYKFTSSFGQHAFDLKTLKGPDRIQLLSRVQWKKVCNYILELHRIISPDDSMSTPKENIIEPIVLDQGYLTPNPCEECYKSRLEEHRNWKNKPILIIKLAIQDEVPSSADISTEDGKRKSRRKGKKPRELIVSGSDSLAKLRLQIYEQLGENLLDQEIYFDGKQLPLEDNCSKLEVFNIEPYSTLYLRYTNIKYNRGMKAHLEESTLYSLLKVASSDDSITLTKKEGFGGTFLGSEHFIDTNDLQTYGTHICIDTDKTNTFNSKEIASVEAEVISIDD